MAIDEEQETARLVSLGRLADKVLKGKGREQMHDLIASEDPELGNQIPELKARKHVEAATKPLHEKIDKLEKENQQNAQFAKLEERRKPLRDKGLSGAEIEAVEKFMVEQGILNHTTAYRLMKEAEQIAAPREAGFGPPSLPKNDDNLYKDPVGARKRAAHQFINDRLAGKPI